MGYGDQVQVIEPDELREIIRTHAENMVRHYQNRDGAVNRA